MNRSHYLLSFIFLFVTTITLAQKPVLEKVKPETPNTIMEFQSETFNWGELEEGEVVQNVFTFTNNGVEPLLISNAKGSCGCTVPRWPKEPILPGESAEILVQFNSKGKGKEGGANQSKRVTITANTEPKNTYLTIKGVVHRLSKEELAKRAALEKEIVEKRSDFDVDAASVQVYPNPSRGIVNLDLKEYAGQSAMIDVFTMQGKRVMTKVIDTIESGAMQLDIQDYKPGVYTVSIKLDGKNRIAKQVILE